VDVQAFYRPGRSGSTSSCVHCHLTKIRCTDLLRSGRHPTSTDYSP
jgi:hypothetical protein